jgi:hypothetical protein
MRKANDADRAVDAKNTEKELIRLAWAMARVVTHDLHGIQMKAGVYAKLLGSRFARRPKTAADAVLLSLMCDLLRGTEWQVLLGRNKPRPKVPAIRWSGRAAVEVVPVALQRLQQLASAGDSTTALVGLGGGE